MISNEDKQEIIKKFIESPKGRSKLASSLIAPLRRSMDYTSIARKAFNVQPLPEITCPSCNTKIWGEHPDNGCVMEPIYNVMET
jgi:hypothetical protein